MSRRWLVVAAVTLGVVIGLVVGTLGEDSRPAPRASTLTSTTIAPTTTSSTTDRLSENPTQAIDQLIDDIAVGYNSFTTPEDDPESTLLSWAFAAGTYDRIAGELRLDPPQGPPPSSIRELSDALKSTSLSLEESIECGQRALIARQGPQACEYDWADTSEVTADLAVSIADIAQFGSRSQAEVLAVFS